MASPHGASSRSKRLADPVGLSSRRGSAPARDSTRPDRVPTGSRRGHVWRDRVSQAHYSVSTCFHWTEGRAEQGAHMAARLLRQAFVGANQTAPLALLTRRSQFVFLVGFGATGSWPAYTVGEFLPGLAVFPRTHTAHVVSTCPDQSLITGPI
ncbi:Hypp6289 [Branchiostoma lanceolatum]|uniref:Hypp6289 protein n=1 Tax=Branchiostoma lanceolatum TaxID=7740 RepID=A0A8J9VII3_BRALA|nr:Hypp6289 [Branchiostoma lanceolatum]